MTAIESAQPQPATLLAREMQISPALLQEAESIARTSGHSLLRTVAKLGLVSEPRLADALAQSTGLPRLANEQVVCDFELLRLFNPSFLKQSTVVPLRRTEVGLEVALADPTDARVLEALKFAASATIFPAVATFSAVDAALTTLEESQPEPSSSRVSDDTLEIEDAEALRDLASDAPVVRLVQRLISEAVERKASDIHFEPRDEGLSVRYRVDGVLAEAAMESRGQRAAIVSRLKIMAGLNIAERRLPQDGRIRVTVHGRETDFRVATAPTIFGESVVLRILDRQEVALDFDALGFDADVTATIRDALSRPYGIVLCTGPTGSGKTTTLYAALRELNTTDRKILTVEDPVEYTLAGINQTHVRPQIGYGFAAALRSFLRHDPDVLMVGEIRDRETAEIAIQAALTGHLLLSTLHTNTASGAVTRLLDMGIDDYLLTSTLGLVIGQRLVRKLCSACRESFTAEAALVERFASAGLADGATLYRARGCAQCGGTGYSGRTSILELLTLAPSVQALILSHGDARIIEQEAVRLGMRTMFQHGVAKVLAGTTTLTEVLRVTRAT
jgi:general secretion pathway protein E